MEPRELLLRLLEGKHRGGQARLFEMVLIAVPVENAIEAEMKATHGESTNVGHVSGSRRAGRVSARRAGVPAQFSQPLRDADQPSDAVR